MKSFCLPLSFVFLPSVSKILNIKDEYFNCNAGGSNTKINQWLSAVSYTVKKTDPFEFPHSDYWKHLREKCGTSTQHAESEHPNEITSNAVLLCLYLPSVWYGLGCLFHFSSHPIPAQTHPFSIGLLCFFPSGRFMRLTGRKNPDDWRGSL